MAKAAPTAAAAPQVTIIRTQAEISEASNEQLVATYNALLGKSIKKFESRGIAEAKVSMAILSAQDAAGHAGVPKDTSTPKAMTAEELATHQRNKEDPTMAKSAAKKTASPPERMRATPDSPAPTPAAKKAKAKPAPAPVVAAKKGKATAAAPAPAAPAPAAKKGKATAAAPAPAAKGDRHNTYSRVKYTEPDTTRRPQEGSKRTVVLNALKAKGESTLEGLSADVGFDVRPYVHKLVAVGFAEILPALAEGK